MKDFEKLRDKLLSLQVMTERGTSNERVNAEFLLDRLLSKHGLTIEQVNELETSVVWFSYRTGFERRLLEQVDSFITGSVDGDCWRERGSRKLGFELTTVQAIDFERFYAHWRKLLADEMELFYSAFVQANSIFAATLPRSKSCASERDMRVLEMSLSITSSNSIRQITGGVS